MTVMNRDALLHMAVGLLEDEMLLPKCVRLLGVSLSSLQTEPEADLNSTCRSESGVP